MGCPGQHQHTIYNVGASQLWSGFCYCHPFAVTSDGEGGIIPSASISRGYTLCVIG